jgi:uncharacterized membrane protein YphA (DoxX/SURF4 family)
MPWRRGGYAARRVKPRAGVVIQRAMMMTRIETVSSWILQLAVAAILLQTLFFKFTGAAESVYIFSALGVEPWGRIGSGVVELAAALLLLVPSLAPFGAALTIAVMLGAIGSHVTVLGIEVMGDGGLLFGLALTACLASVAVLALRRGQTLAVLRSLQVA